MNETDKENNKKENFHRVRRFVLLFILIMIAILDFEIHQNGGGVKGFLSIFLNQDVATVETLDTMYVLLMGVSTDLEKKLTDTMILCAYNPKQQKASMLSIPRDTFVGESQKNAKGSDKINSLYEVSPEKTLEAVSKITGIDISYYAVVNTNVLVEVVDIIGGVDFDVPINMNYDDETQNLHIHLKKGRQKIDGEKAEQLLRFRHSNPDKNGNMTTYSSAYGSDDYGRMRTQREFIIETVRQTLQVKNVTKIKSLMTTVFENLETNLTLDMIFPYVPYAIDFNVTNIESLQLPGVSVQYNNLWFFAYDEEQTQILVENMKNELEGIIAQDGNSINVNMIDNIIVNATNE